jgi:hypothetical protein
VSYGWYLWHWPLLAFLRLDEFGDPSLGARVGVVVIALCPAVAMYLLVERPLRSWSLKNFDVNTMRAAVLAEAGAGALLAGVGLLTSGAISSSLAQRAGPGLVPPPITSRTGEGDACVVQEFLDPASRAVKERPSECYWGIRLPRRAMRRWGCARQPWAHG